VSTDHFEVVVGKIKLLSCSSYYSCNDVSLIFGPGRFCVGVLGVSLIAVGSEPSRGASSGSRTSAGVALGVGFTPRPCGSHLKVGLHSYSMRTVRMDFFFDILAFECPSTFLPSTDVLY
jgi:hypothetical protein